MPCVNKVLQLVINFMIFYNLSKTIKKKIMNVFNN
jgi:hypothetical protein